MNDDLVRDIYVVAAELLAHRVGLLEIDINRNCRLRHAIAEAIELSASWCEFAEMLGKALTGFPATDPNTRTVADILRPATRLLSRNLQRVSGYMKEAMACDVSDEDTVDITNAKESIGKLCVWFDSMPTWDPTQRNKAREDYRKNGALSDEELKKLCQDDFNNP